MGAVLNGHSWLIPESAAKQESLLALNPGSFYRSAKRYTPVSKFSKSKSAYKQKESKVNTFFEDIWFVSKAAKNNLPERLELAPKRKK